MPSKAVRTAEAKRKIRTYIGIGIATLLILLITLATAGRQQTLRCDRHESGDVDCVLQDSILGVFSLKDQSIAGAKAVSIDQQCVDVNCKYRLQILANQGMVPIKENYTSNFDQQVEIKEQLNEFFIDEARSFVSMKEETNPVLLSGVVVVCVLVLAYLGYLTWQTLHEEKDGEARQD